MTSPCAISNMSRGVPGDDGLYRVDIARGCWRWSSAEWIGVGFAEDRFGCGLMRAEREASQCAASCSEASQSRQ